MILFPPPDSLGRFKPLNFLHHLQRRASATRSAKKLWLNEKVNSIAYFFLLLKIFPKIEYYTEGA